MIRSSPLAVLIAKARKRLGGSTVDTFTLNRVYLMAVTEISESLGPEESARRLFEWGYAMGHAYLLKLEKDMRAYPPNLRTVRFIGRLAWYMFSGNDPQVEAWEEQGPGGPWFHLSVRDPKSPWASGVSMGRRICHYPAGAYEAAGSTFFALVEDLGHYVVSRETKCIARGDEYCELTWVAVPKSVPLDEAVRRLRPRFGDSFEEIPPEMTADLYRKVFGRELGGE